MINWYNINQSIIQLNEETEIILDKIIKNFQPETYNTIFNYFENDEQELNLRSEINNILEQNIYKNEWIFLKTYTDNNIIKLTCTKNDTDRIKILYINKKRWLIAYQIGHNFIIILNNTNIVTNKFKLCRNTFDYNLNIDIDNIRNAEELYIYLKKEINILISWFSYELSSSDYEDL